MATIQVGHHKEFPADEANVDTVLNTMDGLCSIPTVHQRVKGLIRLHLMSKVRLKLVHLPLTQLQRMLMAKDLCHSKLGIPC